MVQIPALLRWAALLRSFLFPLSSSFLRRPLKLNPSSSMNHRISLRASSPCIIRTGGVSFPSSSSPLFSRHICDTYHKPIYFKACRVSYIDCIGCLTNELHTKTGTLKGYSFRPTIIDSIDQPQHTECNNKKRFAFPSYHIPLVWVTITNHFHSSRDEKYLHTRHGSKRFIACS